MNYTTSASTLYVSTLSPEVNSDAGSEATSASEALNLFFSNLVLGIYVYITQVISLSIAILSYSYHITRLIISTNNKQFIDHRRWDIGLGFCDKWKIGQG